MQGYIVGDRHINLMGCTYPRQFCIASNGARKQWEIITFLCKQPRRDHRRFLLVYWNFASASLYTL